MLIEKRAKGVWQTTHQINFLSRNKLDLYFN